MDWKTSETAANLMRAFAGESQAREEGFSEIGTFIRSRILRRFTATGSDGWRICWNGTGCLSQTRRPAGSV